MTISEKTLRQHPGADHVVTAHILSYPQASLYFDGKTNTWICATNKVTDLPATVLVSTNPYEVQEAWLAFCRRAMPILKGDVSKLYAHEIDLILKYKKNPPTGDPWIGAQPTHCDVCRRKLDKTMYDAPSGGQGSPWGNLCTSCWRAGGGQLGTGKGQKYTKQGSKWIMTGGGKPKPSASAFHKALESGASMEELEDLLGDGDISEFI